VHFIWTEVHFTLDQVHFTWTEVHFTLKEVHFTRGVSALHSRGKSPSM
jgi:hypothetical protein